MVAWATVEQPGLPKVHREPAWPRSDPAPAILRISPAAICDLPPFFTQTNSTDGVVAVTVTETGSGDGGDAEFVEQSANPFFNVVADGPDNVDTLTGGVVYGPLFIAFSGEDGPGVAAAHRDHYVGGVHDLIDPRFRELVGVGFPAYCRDIATRRFGARIAAKVGQRVQ